jgi:hypothetical protein
MKCRLESSDDSPGREYALPDAIVEGLRSARAERLATSTARIGGDQPIKN